MDYHRGVTNSAEKSRSLLAFPIRCGLRSSDEIGRAIALIRPLHVIRILLPFFIEFHPEYCPPVP